MDKQTLTGHLLHFWCFLYQIFIFTFTQRLISGFPASPILESRAKLAQSAEKVTAASRPLMAWSLWVQAEQRRGARRPASARRCDGHQLSEACLKLLKRRHVSRWARGRWARRNTVSVFDLVTNGNRNRLWGKRPKNSFCFDSSVRL